MWGTIIGHQYMEQKIIPVMSILRDYGLEHLLNSPIEALHKTITLDPITDSPSFFTPNNLHMC